MAEIKVSSLVGLKGTQRSAQSLDAAPCFEHLAGQDMRICILQADLATHSIARRKLAQSKRTEKNKEIFTNKICVQALFQKPSLQAPQHPISWKRIQVVTHINFGVHQGGGKGPELAILGNVQELLNAPNGLFSSGFSRGKTAP